MRNHRQGVTKKFALRGLFEGDEEPHCLHEAFVASGCSFGLN